MEKYLAAADAVLAEAKAERLLVAKPRRPTCPSARRRRRSSSHSRSSASAGRSTDAEVDRSCRLFDAADARGDGFEAAVRLALKGVLVSPSFLFLVEQDRPAQRALGGRRLRAGQPAVVLPLVVDARRGAVRPGRRRAAARARGARGAGPADARDPRSQGAGRGLRRPVARRRRPAHRPPSPTAGCFPEFTPELRDAMYEEAVTFWTRSSATTAAARRCSTADYTFVNERLPKHYGIDGVTAATQRGVRRVKLKDRNRGGVLGHGGGADRDVLPAADEPGAAGQVGAGGAAGHARRRPPPPDVPELPKDDAAKRRPDLPPAAGAAPQATPSAPRATPGWTRSASAWRTSTPSAAGATEIGGRAGRRLGRAAHRRDVHRAGGAEEGAAGTRRTQFVRNLTEKMLAYALRRGLEYYDTADGQGDSATRWRRTTTAGSTLVAEVVEELPVPATAGMHAGRRRR